MYTTFEEELERSGKLVYTNVGVSMLPLLRQGRDVMVIEKSDVYRPLDAVLFRRPGTAGRGAYVLHRILKIMPDGRYWIVGDNCVDGELVERKNIMGVLTGVLRNGKLIRNTDFSYRAYLALWCTPYHVRFIILRMIRKTKRVRRFLSRHLPFYRKITFLSAYPHLFRQTYLPTEADAVRKTMELVRQTGENVRLYHLSCNISPEAALLSAGAMRRHENREIARPQADSAFPENRAQ